MRRLGAWLGVFVLLAGVWGVWRWLGDARPVDAPLAPLVSRTEQVAPGRGAAEFADVAEDVAPREAATSDAERLDVEATASEEASEFACVVRVVDVLDAPIEGARVRIPKRDQIEAQSTDAQGRCTMRGDINAFMMVEVAVEAEGYFLGAGMLVAQPELVVKLRRAAQASGRVLDRATRSPVADARVSSRCTGGDVEADSAVTDASGRFDGLAVPEGETFLVDVEARGYLRPGVRAMAVVGDPADPAAALELLLDAAQPGYFLVVDNEDGRPLADATVIVGRSTLATDAEGRVFFDSALRPSDLLHSVQVRARDHCTVRFDVQGFGTPDAPLVMRLPQACRVEGVVRPAAGEKLPLCRLLVHLARELSVELNRTGPGPVGFDSVTWPDGAKWQESSLQVEFDAQDSGRFVIEGVPPGLTGLELTLAVDAGTLAKRRIGPLGGPDSVLRVDWALDPAGTAGLRGRLLLNGDPHYGFVRLERDGIERVSNTADDGRYAFGDLTAGVQALHCELRGDFIRWGDLGVQTVDVQLVQGESMEHDLRFEIPMGTIRGTLCDARGAPLAGVQVQATNREHDVKAWCDSASDGSWSIAVPVVATPYVLSCRRSLGEHDVEVLAGAEGVALREVARGRLRFRVLDAVTGEILTAPVLAKPVAGNLAQPISVSTWPDMEPSGWCEKELPAGPIELGVFTHDGLHRSERRVLEIPADGVCEAEFRLGAAVTLELRLVPEGGPLPENHVLLLLPEAEWELVTAQLGPGYPRLSFDALPFDPTRQRDLRLWPGRAHVVGSLAPGRYRFKVFPDDVALKPEWIDVPSEGIVNVSWSSKP